MRLKDAMHPTSPTSRTDRTPLETRDVVILDGPVGTELEARGVSTTLPLWSARAIDEAPDVLAAVHADYAAAGASLHVAATFRTQPRWMGSPFERAARRAVQIARASIARGMRLAGSLAPVEDCYRPDLSPGVASRAEHRALARVLAAAGVDLLLCETFPHVTEALVAVEEAVATGVPTWVSFTAGPSCDLLTPREVSVAATRAVALGASAVLINCIPARRTEPYVAAISGAGVPFGAYANAGSPDDVVGWRSSDVPSTEAYVAFAGTWRARGATIVGGCCGTRPAHVAALSRAFIRRDSRPG